MSEMSESEQVEQAPTGGEASDQPDEEAPAPPDEGDVQADPTEDGEASGGAADPGEADAAPEATAESPADAAADEAPDDEAPAPGDASEPADPTEPADATDLDRPAEPSELTEPEPSIDAAPQADGPGEAAPLAEPAESTEPMEPAEPGESAAEPTDVDDASDEAPPVPEAVDADAVDAPPPLDGMAGEAAGVEQEPSVARAPEGTGTTESTESDVNDAAPDVAPTEPEAPPVSRAAADDTGDSPGTLDDRLQGYYDLSEQTPGGRSFYPADDTAMRDAAMTAQPEAGKYTVDMHGNSDSAYIGRDAISADDLASMVENDPNYDGGPIRLMSCETGAGDYAQQLADRLDTTVEAPDQLAWSDRDGNTFVSSMAGYDQYGNPIPTEPHDGNWITFHPRTRK
jgi:hypothetical protein